MNTLPSSARKMIRHLALAGFAVLAPLSAHADLLASDTPNKNFDLSHWKLTLPVASDGSTSGKAATISTAKLTSGYVSPWFYTDGVDGQMSFWSPVVGATTSGSPYTRSELREMLNPNDDSVNWNLDGESILDARASVQQVPSASGRVVVGQIHGYTDGPLIKITYMHDFGTGLGTLVAQLNATPSATSAIDFVLATNLHLGDDFTYRIDVLNHTVTVSSETGASNTWVIDPSWNTSTLYFKAGAYTIAQGTNSTDGSAVSFSRLAATHPNNALDIMTDTVHLSAGVPLAVPLQSSGGVGPMNWSLVSGQLPNGLDLDPATGTLTGILPMSDTGTVHSFSVQVRDNLGDTAAQNYDITVTQ